MKLHYIKRQFMLLLIAISPLLLVSNYAIASSYETLKVKNLYQIDIPSHWILHDEADILNFSAAAEAITKYQQPGKETLLAVSSNISKEPISKIRLSIESPEIFTSQDLLEVTKEDLEELRVSYVRGFNSIQSMPFKVKHIYPVEIVNLNGHASLMLHYERTGMGDSNLIWHVYQYQIPMDNGYMYRFTTSYQELAENHMKLIVKRIEESLKLY